MYQQEFEQRFLKYIECKIAVYGTGQNAKLIAENVQGFQIIGFISKDIAFDSFFGYRMISIEEAVEKAEIIIIAATASATNIVLSRIRSIVPEQIAILNLYGEVLNQTETYRDNSYWEKTYHSLCAAIDAYSVISFDIFDTLIMRRTLQPSDIFELTEENGGKGRCGNTFAKYRLEAERQCNGRMVAPSLAEIYQFMIERGQIDSIEAECLKAEELLCEERCIIPRRVMVEAFYYAIEKKKKIFLTTDMYIPQEILKKYLGNSGITGSYELLLSCEESATKQEGELYEILKDKTVEDRILHIGDNAEIDGRMARKKRIDVFVVLSGYDLLAASSFVSVLDAVNTKDDRNYLGYFVSNLLNDPFALSEKKGKLTLSTCEDIALVVYPMTMMYLNYICATARSYDCLVFPSRDGFFLYQLYQVIRSRAGKGVLPRAEYVYASRMALSRAALSGHESFHILMGKLFRDETLNCKEYVKNQFGFTLPEEFAFSSGQLIQKWGKDGFEDRLDAYMDEMIKNLENSRKAYIEYIEETGIFECKSIALVDIVSYGTQVYCLSEILGRPLDMLTLGTTDIPNVYVNDASRVHSVYGNINKSSGGTLYSCSDLSTLHLFLELLYSSTDGQFVGFEGKKPIFWEGTEYNKHLVSGVQREIFKIMWETEQTGFHYENISKEFAIKMMELLFHQYSDIEQSLKEQFVFHDPYVERLKRVNLADML